MELPQPPPSLTGTRAPWDWLDWAHSQGEQSQITRLISRPARLLLPQFSLQPPLQCALLHSPAGTLLPRPHHATRGAGPRLPFCPPFRLPSSHALWTKTQFSASLVTALPTAPAPQLWDPGCGEEFLSPSPRP